jgi:hypothetical protein
MVWVIEEPLLAVAFPFGAGVCVVCKEETESLVIRL